MAAPVLLPQLSNVDLSTLEISGHGLVEKAQGSQDLPVLELTCGEGALLGTKLPKKVWLVE